MKGGINFEEWKEIVKKNRRSLRSKSNSFKFEPESLTYGAEKAVKSPEYGQVYTITYNVTGMEVPSDWPTEIKSGKTLVLSGITGPYGAIATVSANVPHTYEDEVLTIPNIQKSPNITVLIGDVLYENAKIGDYLYDDWTFGPTEKPGYIARCVGLSSDFPDGMSRWCGTQVSNEMNWLTGDYETTGLTYYNSETIRTNFSGKENTNALLNLPHSNRYLAARWAALLIDGTGYLPSAGELIACRENISSLPVFSRLFTVHSSTEKSRTEVWYVSTSKTGVIDSYFKHVNNYRNVIAFCQLSGPCGKPINNNGHEYVDLGLPSGTLWANVNVGASSATDYGNYYMYGMGSKTYDSTDTPYSGTEDPLDLSKDTARQTWGGDWHMPTEEQILELIDNTAYQWVTNYNSSVINGCLFTATNGAVLFLPAAGYQYSSGQSEAGNSGLYWSSSPADDDANYPCYLLSDNNRTNVGSYLERNRGLSVRPVIG